MSLAKSLSSQVRKRFRYWRLAALDIGGKECLRECLRWCCDHVHMAC